MRVIDNFLDPQLAHELERHILDQLDKPVWIHGHSFYHEELRNYIVETMAPYIATLDKPLALKLRQHLESNSILTGTVTDYEALIYNAYPLSSVGWHTDKHDEYEHGGTECMGCRDVAGISIYLNRDWRPNWGGSFLLKDHRDATQGTFYEPIYNRAVINNGRDVHAVSAITNGAHNRYSVQLFVNRSALRLDLQ
jgi:Rps23 Pro-64 3,4-dihydroxylase Tpa1-like proline 4-hydroxylase